MSDAVDGGESDSNACKSDTLLLNSAIFFVFNKTKKDIFLEHRNWYISASKQSYDFKLLY